MTSEAQVQIRKAFRSLPWYLFLAPGLLLLFFLIMQSNELSQDYLWVATWAFMRVGLFVWVLRQLLRYAIYKHLPRISLDQVLPFSAPVSPRDSSARNGNARQAATSVVRPSAVPTVEAVFIRSGRLGRTR